MACHEIGLVDIVRRADGLVAEAQVADRHAAGLLRVILEVGLDIFVGMVADDLGGVLVGADRAVAAQAPELALDGAFGSRVGRGLLLQREVGDVVVDAQCEALLRSVLRQFFIYGKHAGRRGILAAQAIAAADDGALAARFAERGHNVQMERLGQSARLLGAVQHRDLLRGGRNGGQQLVGRERTVQADLHQTDLLALGGEVINDFLGHVADGAHGDDDAVCVGSTVVLEQLVVGTQLRVHLAHVFFHNAGHGLVELIAGLTVLEEDIAVLVGAAHSGVLGVQRMGAERLHRFHVRHFLQVVVIPDLDLLDLVAGTEAVEEVDERHTALQRGQVRHSSQVHDLLRVGLGQHGKARLAAGIYVGMIAEDVQRMAGHGTGGNMEHGGQQLTGDLIHVGDHQQQALGRGERGGQRAGSQGAVHGAGRARLGLHLNNFHFGAEDVLLVQGGPLVHLVGHGARRGDGVDAGNFGKRIGYMSRSGVAVHRFLGSWHFSSSGSFFIPPRRQMIPGGGWCEQKQAFCGGIVSALRSSLL